MKKRGLEIYLKSSGIEFFKMRAEKRQKDDWSRVGGGLEWENHVRSS
jgi:hypothetical protein